MTRVTVQDLERIQQICQEAEVESFELESDSRSGIGTVLTMTYDSRVANRAARVSVEISGVQDW